MVSDIDSNSASSISRILVVEDDDVDLEILVKVLSGEGHTVHSATNGKNAIELFERIRPDIVLMDVMLDGMDGFDIARLIAEYPSNKFTPIIFTTALTDSASITRCFESGGIDVLHKPFNYTVLKSKVRTFGELSQLYATSIEQRDALESYNSLLKNNYEVAENVFNKVMHSDVLDMKAIQYSLSPIAVFNGDILLAAYRPSGELNVMMGDFTGHGLPAAIGAIPVSDIFYGMSAKGYGMIDIMAEINSKVSRILPRGLFLAACALEYDSDPMELSIINAGLPDMLVFNAASQKVEKRFVSKNYPLGVSADPQPVKETHQVQKDDMVLMFTDGVVESQNEQGEMYGLDRLICEIEGCAESSLIDGILGNLNSFLDGNQKTDDITILQMDVCNIDKRVKARTEVIYPDPVIGSEWKASFYFGPAMLRNCDPLPNIIQTVMEFQKLQKFRQDIFVILKELFINALDHGLLELNSQLKDQPDGFTLYLAEKKARLEELEIGIISIEIIHKATESGGYLDFYVNDTGKGFDISLLENKPFATSAYHGRGILMMKSICESVTYNEVGNQVHARYRWDA